MKNLFEEVKFGNILLKNRFIRSATWENLTDEKGHLNSNLYSIYEELADSQVGLIITGYANVVKEEQPNPGMMGIYNDSFIEEYKKLTDSVHKKGSKIIMQIAYGGTKTKFNTENRIIFAPSNVPERMTKVMGQTMAKTDIDYIVEAFAQAGRRIKEAGFDGVELHGAHSYLINQFLSPYYNRRTDEYGGSLDNRMRFLVEIYEKTREKVGKDFLIMVKLTASDFFEGGLTFEDTKIIAKTLEKLGVNAIEISGNIHGKANLMTGESFDGHQIRKEGYFVEYAKEIVKDLSIPIVSVGGFRDIEVIEKLLNEGSLEFFALSRPLLAEPDLIKRWQKGDRRKAICISCSKCRSPKGNFCTIFKKSL